MPLFDEAEQRIVVEVVYDGPAFAGKTTNLKQLCEFFTEQRRSRLFSAQNSGHRTLYLDWLQVEGGVVAGRKLRCQMLTVPGQTVLARRRWHLLRRADAVVFVVDSTPPGIDEARRMFDALREHAKELPRDLPIIVQANKQDKVGAVSPEQVARALRANPEKVVPAQADTGIGVRETAVLAIRAVADLVQRRVLNEGLESLLGQSQSGEDIQREIEEEEARAPQRPVDIVMQQAQKTIGSALSGLANAVERELPSEAEWGTDSEAPEAPRQSEGGVPQVPEVVANNSAVQDAGSGVPVHAREGSVSHSEVTVTPSKTETDSMRARRADQEMVPPLPECEVASGLIWPSATGRELLRRVPLVDAEWRQDLVGQVGTKDGSGRSDTVIVEAGLWCLKTSPRRRFTDVDRARESLLVLARRKISLGTLLAKNTVLMLQPDSCGAHWLWTISPWLTTLRSTMTYSDEHQQLESLAEALQAYAGAALHSLRLALSRGVQLDIHPSNFARLGEHTYYVDDDIAEGSQVPTIGHSLLRRVEEFSHRPAIVEGYVDHLVRGLRDEFSTEDVKELRLREALASTIVTSAAGQAARTKLLESC